MTDRYDVIVVGGGPSGSTAGNLLAKGGARVLVIEREVFPRFHIGESLLPANLRVFDRIGYHPEGDEHLRKSGAVFHDESTGREATYLFAESLSKVADHAYQVERSTFDLALLEAAAASGAEVHQGERVTAIDLNGGTRDPRIETDKGAYSARYVFDASGLDAFMAYGERTRRRLDIFGLGSIYRHYELAPAIADELAVEGNIRLLFVEGGWMWAIPLGRGRLSVGLTTRRKGLDAARLEAELARSEVMSRILAGGRPEGPAKTMASFSFVNDRPYGPRWSCLGDAACFLDPMFSSGVNLGMVGAAHASDVLLPALESGDEGAAELMGGHAQWMKEGCEVFATLLNAIYQRRLLPDLFFTRDQDPLLRRGMTSVLAGDVWGEDNPFTEMVQRSRLRVRLDPS